MKDVVLTEPHLKHACELCNLFLRGCFQILADRAYTLPQYWDICTNELSSQLRTRRNKSRFQELAGRGTMLKMRSDGAETPRHVRVEDSPFISNKDLRQQAARWPDPCKRQVQPGADRMKVVPPTLSLCSYFRRKRNVGASSSTFAHLQ